MLCATGERIALAERIPFKLRADHPFRSQALARAFYWFLAREPERAVPFARAAFYCCYALGRHPVEPEHITAIAAAFTRNPGTRGMAPFG